MVATLREQLLQQINEMSEEQIEATLRYVSTLHPEDEALAQYMRAISPNNLPVSYDAAKDPFLNGEFIVEGPEDWSERTEDYLN